MQRFILHLCGMRRRLITVLIRLSRTPAPGWVAEEQVAGSFPGGLELRV